MNTIFSESMQDTETNTRARGVRKVTTGMITGSIAMFLSPPSLPNYYISQNEDGFIKERKNYSHNINVSFTVSCLQRFTSYAECFSCYGHSYYNLLQTVLPLLFLVALHCRFPTSWTSSSFSLVVFYLLLLALLLEQVQVLFGFVRSSENVVRIVETFQQGKGTVWELVAMAVLLLLGVLKMAMYLLEGWSIKMLLEKEL